MPQYGKCEHYQRIWASTHRGEFLETKCDGCPACIAHTHSTTKKVGKMQLMHFPHLPFRSLAVDIFHYPKVKRGGVKFAKFLLYVCRLSSYLEAIPHPKGDATGKHVLSYLWTDRSVTLESRGK